MVAEHGWLIPQHYGDMEAEVRACRETIGVFDESSCSRIRVGGAGGAGALEKLLSFNIRKLAEGKQRYGVFCNEQGGIVEDGMVQHQGKSYLFIGNPQNRERLLNLLQEYNHSSEVKIDDETESTAMITLMGPKVVDLLKEKMPFDTDELAEDVVLVRNYFFMRIVIAQNRRPVPGATLILPAKMAAMGWELLEKYGEKYGICPAGFRARDMLYKEGGIPRYGEELNEDINPFAAGLEDAVDLDRSFVGSVALAEMGISQDQ